MTSIVADWTCRGLPPLVGIRVTVVSFGLEHCFDRARGLEAFGYHVASCSDPTTTGGCIAAGSAGAVIVDLGRDVAFPDEVVARIREHCTSPILVVGCAGTYVEMLRCFEAGADDYCRPRCQTEEIDLRLRALFRRMSSDGSAAPREAHPATVHVGDIEIDQVGQIVRKHGATVSLSRTEFRLLATLAERAGEVVPSKALVVRVWGNQYAGETQYLRLYIRYLRQKLEDDPKHPTYIVNRWGSGYALESPVSAVA